MRYAELGLQYLNLGYRRGDSLTHSTHSAHRAPSVWNILASLIISPTSFAWLDSTYSLHVWSAFFISEPLLCKGSAGMIG